MENLQRRNILKSKTTATLLSTILIVSIACSTLAMPLVSAHDPPWTVPNFCYIMVSPTTVGINQQVLIIFWVNTYPPTASGAAGDRWKFNIEITKPDGTKTTTPDLISDPIGGGYYTFTPDKVGTYSFKVKFPAQKLTGLPGYLGSPNTPISNAAVNDTYGPSESRIETLTVQSTPVQSYQETPMMNGYWTRPVSGINRMLYPAMGNWMAWGPAQTQGPTTSQFAYGPGPESAHVLWSKPIASGGLADERFGSVGYTTYHYAGLSFSPPIIIDGKLIYTEPQNPRFGQWVVDLYTGKTLYFRNSTGSVTGYTPLTGFDAYGAMTQGLFTYGWVYNPELPNQHGVYNYLIVTSTGKTNAWQIYDAKRGDYICTVENVSASGTGVYGEDGSFTFYSITGSGATQRLLCWNLTRAIWFKPQYGLYYPATDKTTEIPATITSNVYWMWRPYMNYTFDGRNGYSINVSLPVSLGSGISTIRTIRENDGIWGGSSGTNNPGSPIVPGVMWKMNLNPAKGAIGAILSNITFTSPATTGNMTVSFQKASPEDDVFVFGSPQGLCYWGYSLTTGQKLWGPDTGVPKEMDGNFYGLQNWFYQGMLITSGYGGQLRAYEAKTGKIAWTYNATTTPFESPYGNNYPINVGLIADGKIYIGAGEHSPTQPVWRGNVLQCINASNGALLWNFPCYGVSQPSGNAGNYFAAADGRLLALNAYDDSIYCFGTGPSETTVSAPNVATPQGTAIMISGTVTDQSPSGRLDVNDNLDIALKGQPCISDADQSDFMQYLYQQRPFPTNAKGVTVKLTAIDPNGNWQSIGSVTSDNQGNFGLAWTPPVPGSYKITATFEGSNAYAPSAGTTYCVVGAAATPATVVVTVAPSITAQPTSPNPIVTESPTAVVTATPTTPEGPTGTPTSTIYAIAAAAVVIIIVAIAAVALRKRK